METLQRWYDAFVCWLNGGHVVERCVSARKDAHGETLRFVCGRCERLFEIRKKGLTGF